MQMASQRVKNFVSFVDYEEKAQGLKFRFTYFNEILYHIIKRRRNWSMTFHDVIKLKKYIFVTLAREKVHFLCERFIDFNTIYQSMFLLNK
jgi:hypothetical protein